MATYTCDHVHLRSLDPTAAARFYVGMFGAVPRGTVAVGSAVREIVALGGLTLFIEQVPAGTGAPPAPPFLGVEHVGLAVDDLDAAVAELTAKGAVFTVLPHSPRPGLRIAFVQAPDGVRVEVLQRSET